MDEREHKIFDTFHSHCLFSAFLEFQILSGTIYSHLYSFVCLWIMCFRQSSCQVIIRSLISWKSLNLNGFSPDQLYLWRRYFSQSFSGLSITEQHPDDFSTAMKTFLPNYSDRCVTHPWTPPNSVGESE